MWSLRRLSQMTSREDIWTLLKSMWSLEIIWLPRLSHVIITTTKSYDYHDWVMWSLRRLSQMTSREDIWTLLKSMWSLEVIWPLQKIFLTLLRSMTTTTKSCDHYISQCDRYKSHVTTTAPNYIWKMNYLSVILSLKQILNWAIFCSKNQ